MKLILRTKGQQDRAYDSAPDTVVISDAYRRCPKCRAVKPLTDYGMRNMGDGVMRLQPQCISCRGKSDG